MKQIVLFVLLGWICTACSTSLTVSTKQSSVAAPLSSSHPQILPNQPAASNPEASKSRYIKVATVQMHSAHDLETNVQKIVQWLEECARQGVRVVLFPECATTGYFADEIPNYSEAQLLEAERKIAAAARDNRIYCIVGSPYFQNGVRYNMALVINDRGETIYRQAKIQLVPFDRWAKPGNAMSLFEIDGILCSIFICHDSRYPELVRLPVLKGARLIFYLSCESDVTVEQKLIPYRAQLVARAVENGVYIVQSNTPQNLNPLEGSHGQSKIVDPDGTLLREGSIFKEEVLIEELDMNRAKAAYARKSLRPDFLRDWWENGVQRIGDPEP